MFFFLTKIATLFFINIFISIGLVNLHVLIYYAFVAATSFFFFKNKKYVQVGIKSPAIITIVYNTALMGAMLFI